MESENSLRVTQEPSTCPYPGADYSEPPHSNSLGSILTLPSHLLLGLISGFFLLAFPTKSYMRSSSLQCVLHVLLKQF
jgi:hypothetical protein